MTLALRRLQIPWPFLARELIDACPVISGELETQAERVGNNSYLAKQLTDLRHEMTVVSL